MRIGISQLRRDKILERQEEQLRGAIISDAAKAMQSVMRYCICSTTQEHDKKRICLIQLGFQADAIELSNVRQTKHGGRICAHFLNMMLTVSTFLKFMHFSIKIARFSRHFRTPQKSTLCRSMNPTTDLKPTHIYNRNHRFLHPLIIQRRLYRQLVIRSCKPTLLWGF